MIAARTVLPLLRELAQPPSEELFEARVEGGD